MAAAARIGWSATLTFLVGLALPSAAASFTLQMLFVQGGLIALISASAYTRAVHIAPDLAETRRQFAGFLTFVLISCLVFASVGGWVVRGHGVSETTKWLSVLVLVTGAGATSLNGFMQGVVTTREGVARSFTPTIVVSASACAAALSLLVWPEALVALTIWSAAQILVPLGLLLRSPPLREVLRWRLGSWGVMSSFVGVGGVNATSVGVQYEFREAWARNLPVQVPADGFYVTRLTELCYQVFYMVVASSSPRIKDRIAKILAQRRYAAALCSATVGFGIAGFGATEVLGKPGLINFAIAELCVSPLRLITTVTLVVLLSRGSMRTYVVAMGAASLAVALMVTGPWMTRQNYGLELMQVLFCMVVVLVGLSAPAWRRGGQPDAYDEAQHV